MRGVEGAKVRLIWRLLYFANLLQCCISKLPLSFSQGQGHITNLRTLGILPFGYLAVKLSSDLDFPRSLVPLADSQKIDKYFSFPWKGSSRNPPRKRYESSTYLNGMMMMMRLSLMKLESRQDCDWLGGMASLV